MKWMPIAESRSRRVAVACLFTGLLAACVAQDVDPSARRSTASLPIEASIRTAIHERIAAAMERQRIPGLQCAMSVDGRIVFDEGFGFADLENEVATTKDTRFRTASIAKPMTAVAVMQLVEAGRIDLDQDVRSYVEAFPEKRWKVTPRALLGHLGGVRHYLLPGESSGTQHYANLTASLACFAKDPLVVKPGERYVYTTYGYTLLGCAIETAAQAPYAKVLQTALWSRAGMKATCVDDETRLLPQRARGYCVDGDEVRPAALHDTSMKVPGGGLRSTAGDIVRFGIALLEDRLVSPATRATMWTEQTTRDGKKTGYGLGFGLVDKGALRVVQHSGGQAGTASFLRIVPARSSVVAIMTNREGASLGLLASDLEQILVDSRKR